MNFSNIKDSVPCDYSDRIRRPVSKGGIFIWALDKMKELQCSVGSNRQIQSQRTEFLMLQTVVRMARTFGRFRLRSVWLAGPIASHAELQCIVTNYTIYMPVFGIRYFKRFRVRHGAYNGK